jgi:hypothetical protein
LSPIYRGREEGERGAGERVTTDIDSIDGIHGASLSERKWGRERYGVIGSAPQGGFLVWGSGVGLGVQLGHPGAGHGARPRAARGRVGVGLGRRRLGRTPGAGRPGAAREGNASLGGQGRGEKAGWGWGVYEREEGGRKRRWRRRPTGEGGAAGPCWAPSGL